MNAVFVTGAASGIGRATAIRLARDGHAVGLCDRDRAGLRRTAAEVRGENATAVPVEADVRDAASIASAAEIVAGELGGLSAAVASAGVWVPGDVLSVGAEGWDRAIGVNLGGVLHTAQACLPHLLEQGSGGSFVAIASDAGLWAGPGCAAYVASKHAVVGLVRSIAIDFAPRGIRANVLCPGFVDTPLAEQVFADGAASQSKRTRAIPVGRFASPEEIAGTVAFLLGPDASYFNGEALRCDGGIGAGAFVSGS